MYPKICKYRTETAIAQTRVECYVLSRHNLQQLSKMQPTFADRLKVMCTITAAEYVFSNEAVERLTEMTTSKLGFSRMDRRVDEIKTGLIAAYNDKLSAMGMCLAGNPKGLVLQGWMQWHNVSSDTFQKIVYSCPEAGCGHVGTLDMKGLDIKACTMISCTFTAAGQILYAAHAVEALSAKDLFAGHAEGFFARDRHKNTHTYTQRRAGGASQDENNRPLTGALSR